jgi:hypothetical protein
MIRQWSGLLRATRGFCRTVIGRHRMRIYITLLYLVAPAWPGPNPNSRAMGTYPFGHGPMPTEALDGLGHPLPACVLQLLEQGDDVLTHGSRVWDYRPPAGRVSGSGNSVAGLG